MINLIDNVEIQDIDKSIIENLELLDAEEVDIVVAICHFRKDLKKPYELEKKILKNYPSIKNNCRCNR